MSENGWGELVVIFVVGILVVLIAARIGEIVSRQLNIFGF